MANGPLPEITLDELARLIRLLGMLGSASDGEVLAAGKFAAKWVREHDTDWQTLLVPPAEAGVVSVAAVPDPEQADLAYQQGYEAGVAAGIAKAMAQVKAQATMAAGLAAARPWTAPQGSVSGFGLPPGGSVGQTGQGPVRAPAAPPAGGWPLGSWQAVCQELLDRHAAVPGVLRSREEQFVSDVLARGFPNLTAAQEAWLRDIAGRAGLSW